ncbi:hypothetical protein RMCBS344292_04296 [Rhizopus microsporus]|nr:hypothetical protein RMCBS344292_04296 [Rhizopus microsporus]
MSQSRKNDKSSDENDIYCLDKANSEEKNEILKDLLWTLYSKLEAVLRGHRFIETCARRIKKRLITAKANNSEAINIYHFNEIWRPVQAEIRSILKDYLTSQEQSIVSVDEPGTKKGFQDKRDMQKQLFSFLETTEDPQVEDAYSELENRLFVSFKKQILGFSGDRPHSTIIDKYANDISSKGYKVLVKPDAYNVSVLLSPTMAFLNRVKEVFPSYDDHSEEGFGSFLDDFAVNVFLPQIEEKVMQLIQHATVGLDAFQDVRDYKTYSKYPIAKSAVALISVVQSLCRTMHTMPFHTDEYVRLIEIVLLKFYEKCYQRFYSTVARGSSHMSEQQQQNMTDVTISLSGDWAQDESLISLLTQNPYFTDASGISDSFHKSLHQSEIQLELKLKNDRQLDASELIFDTKKFISLGRLYHTLKWFVREIWELRSTGISTSHSNVDKREEKKNLARNGLRDSKRWSSEVPRPTREPGEQEANQALLPLRGDMAKRFDALLTTYQQLAETCLFTLRLEGRCHTMYYLEMVIRNGNYCLEDESFEPDPYIITLNADLMELNDCVNASLPPKDELKLNNNGIQKMTRNILALQQNLSNFVPLSQCAIMEQAREYYQLYNAGSEGMIKSIRENGPKFTFDEYLIMLRLIHGISPNQEENELSDKAANSLNYSEWLRKLDEAMADYEN